MMKKQMWEQQVLGILLSSAAVFLVVCSLQLVMAADEDPLQDFCVADLNPAITINGRTCKPAAQVVAQDFASPLLRNPAPFQGKLGSAVNLASVSDFPGLNTLGLSIARIDFQPNGLNPPHVHPRATEVLYLVQGTLTVGFVTALPANNTLFQQTLFAGDLFVFPRGLVHFQLNTHPDIPALAISALNSQNPGVSLVSASLFAVNPPLPPQVLQITLGVGQQEINRLTSCVSAVLGTAYETNQPPPTDYPHH